MDFKRSWFTWFVNCDVGYDMYNQVGCSYQSDLEYGIPLTLKLFYNTFSMKRMRSLQGRFWGFKCSGRAWKKRPLEVGNYAHFGPFLHLLSSFCKFCWLDIELNCKERKRRQLDAKQKLEMKIEELEWWNIWWNPSF